MQGRRSGQGEDAEAERAWQVLYGLAWPTCQTLWRQIHQHTYVQQPCTFAMDTGRCLDGGNATVSFLHNNNTLATRKKCVWQNLLAPHLIPVLCAEKM